MSILSTDIKLLASERMTDTTDGGGRRTSNVIPDGVAGNILSRVSRLDSTYGRVNMRKVYAQVDTPTGDTYAGAHAVLLDAPDNDRIHVNIFSTASEFDTRTAARDRIESYVIAGPESRMVMYGRQLLGQAAFTAFQRVEETLPEIGDVFCLSKEVGGVVQAQQFVQVQEVAHEVRTFEDSQGEFQRRIVTMKTGSTLRYEFLGPEQITRALGARTSLVRTTNVADASRYYGIQPVVGSYAAGTLEMRVASIYSPIVPTAQREAVIANAEIAGATAFVATAPAAVTRAMARTAIAASPFAFRVEGGIMPGTVALSVQSYVPGFAQVANTWAFEDQGDGTLLCVSSSLGGVFVGQSYAVDYETGVIAFVPPTGIGSTEWGASATFMPAVAVGQPSHTLELPVTLATRGTVQVVTLHPLPAAGTVVVDYRALGKWYRLRDVGQGEIRGADAAYGTGSVDVATGSVVVTLGALPDVESSVIFSWASPQHTKMLVGASSDVDTKVHQQFNVVGAGTALPIQPGSCTLSFVSGGVTYAAAVDGAGNVSGNGVTGKLDAVTGNIALEYSTKVPDPGSSVLVGFNKQNPAVAGQLLEQHATVNLAGAGKTFGTPVPQQVSTLRLEVPIIVPSFAGSAPYTRTLRASANASGEIVTLPAFETFSLGAGTPVYSHTGGDVIGHVNYGTGVVTLSDGAVVTMHRAFYQYATGGWSPAANVSVPLADGLYFWGVNLDNAVGGTTAQGAPFAVADHPLTINLRKTTLAALVPNSVVFNAFGKVYYDRNGSVFHTLQNDGTGTAAGTIDYGKGEVTLTGWPAGVQPNISMVECLAKWGDYTAVKAVFRTAGSPLRPASTFVQATATDGELLTATTDVDGDIVSAAARGKVNQRMGIVSIEWGAMVPKAGMETEPWYDPANVVGANVWKPREIMPATIRYNAVVQTNLPLNADVIGLDPVRLPSDGRVPIFRAGTVVLVHNTKFTDLPNPAVAGATYFVGRTDLADLVLYDAVGLRLPADRYTANPATGAITMANPLNLAGYSQPLKAKHRIEELNLLADAQINGQISLSSPLARAYDADTFVSGCLLFGDLFSRVSNVFDQVAWTAVWSDARIGDNATAEYNTIGFPIEVKNDGAVTERWRVSFTAPTAFQVIGENLGVVATGTTGADCAPVNPLTGKAYFTIRAAGWGLGWSTGNQLRFNTFGATAPIWMIRTVLPGATLSGDSVDLQVRGDVDA